MNFAAIIAFLNAALAFINNILGPILKRIADKGKAQEDALKDIDTEEGKRSSLPERAIAEKEAEKRLEERVKPQ